MASRIDSPGLRIFLRQELEEDPNATLSTVRQHLLDLCESAPGDAVSEQQHWIVELEELLGDHNEHTAVADLLTE